MGRRIVQRPNPLVALGDPSILEKVSLHAGSVIFSVQCVLGPAGVSLIGLLSRLFAMWPN